MTGEDTVNQALFRRRTFEQDWLAPLITVARRQPVTEQPVGDWALALALVDEAANWLGFGESVGYFAEAKAPELPTGGVVGPWMESTDYSPFDEEAFARDLLTALEDLTPARRTFLSPFRRTLAQKLHRHSEAAAANQKHAPALSHPDTS